MRKWYFVRLLLAVLLFLGCLSNVTYSNAQSKPAISDADWNSFRGFNISAVTITESDLEKLKKNGVTILRLQFADLPLVSDSIEFSFNSVAMAKLDSILGWAEKSGIKIILDPHYFPGMTSRYTTLEKDKLWIDEGLQSKFLKFWDLVSKKYAGNSVLIAYDLLNEPSFGENGVNRWQALSRDAISVIRANDRDKYLILGAVAGKSSAGERFNRITGVSVNPVFDDSRIVYSAHIYTPYKFVTQRVERGNRDVIRYPGFVDGKYWDKNALREIVKPLKQFSSMRRSPVFIGEFSAACWTGGDGDQYLEDLISVLNEQKIGWAYHAYKEAAVWDPELTNKQCEERTKQALVSPSSSQVINRFELIKKYLH